MEMTPKFGQSVRKPMVAMILSASAMSWAGVKATKRGRPPVPEVHLR